MAKYNKLKGIYDKLDLRSLIFFKKVWGIAGIIYIFTLVYSLMYLKLNNYNYVYSFLDLASYFIVYALLEMIIMKKLNLNKSLTIEDLNLKIKHLESEYEKFKKIKAESETNLEFVAKNYTKLYKEYSGLKKELNM